MNGGAAFATNRGAFAMNRSAALATNRSAFAMNRSAAVMVNRSGIAAVVAIAMEQALQLLEAAATTGITLCLTAAAVAAESSPVMAFITTAV